MSEVKEIIVDETMEGLADNVVAADLDIAGADVAGTVVKIVLAVGVAVGAVALYKKVIKPKLAARKANKQCDEATSEQASE